LIFCAERMDVDFELFVEQRNSTKSEKEIDKRDED
jgi:hypothetical protein